MREVPSRALRHETLCGISIFVLFLYLVALSLEKHHRQAIKIRQKQTLPIYKKKLGDHLFTATIYNNLSNNFLACCASVF